MAEYIDRQEAIETVAFYLEDPDGIDHALQSIKSIHVADVQPVKHGRWIQLTQNVEPTALKCSLCGEISCCRGMYCPDCGARMDGDDNG